VTSWPTGLEGLVPKLEQNSFFISFTCLELRRKRVTPRADLLISCFTGVLISP